MRVAFYAPMKPPDDPRPSGDRAMARAFMAALSSRGHSVTLASAFRTHLHGPDPGRQAALAVLADREAEVIADTWAAAGPPEAWFTYHNYHKAPDLLGPRLCRRFALPYCLAEASHAPKRRDIWGGWFAAAEAASRAADLHICMTTRDRECIEPLLGPAADLVSIPPFLDPGDEPPIVPSRGGPVRLVTVAMMRPGDKLASYRFLAAALAGITDRVLLLDIVGDGPARAEVEAAFGPVPGVRITWRGECGPAEVGRALRAADIFVWPGFGEAFGLAYLEAQAAGLPVVALDVAGVSSVVVHDRTGILVSDLSPDAYGRAIAGLAADRDRRDQLRRQARAFVRNERSSAAAATVLDAALRAVLARVRERHDG